MYYYSNCECHITKYRSNCEWIIPKYSGGINIKIMNDIFLNTGLIVNECGRNMGGGQLQRYRSIIIQSEKHDSFVK